MSALTKRFFTEAEYLELEQAAGYKSEYVNGEIVPWGENRPQGMAGASEAHNLIAFNIGGLLYQGLRGRPCRAFGSDMMVRVPATGLRTYPDFSALCDQPTFHPEETSLTNPALIIEVPSPTTERWDRGGKFAHYRRLKSLAAYVLVSQDEMRVELYTRDNDTTWTLEEFVGPESRVPLAVLRCELPLAGIYEHVEFPPAATF